MILGKIFTTPLTSDVLECRENCSLHFDWLALSVPVPAKQAVTTVTSIAHEKLENWLRKCWDSDSYASNWYVSFHSNNKQQATKVL